MKPTYILLLAGAAALLALDAAAQMPITLTQANFPATASTVERYWPVELVRPGSAVALPQLGANQLWDYSGLVADSAMLEQRFQASVANAQFMTATRSYAEQPTTVEQYATGRRAFDGATQQYEALTANGLQRLGYTVAARQMVLTDPNSLASVSWEVPAQHVGYGGYVYRLRFPMTANSPNGTTYRTVTQLLATEPGLGLSAAPVRLVRWMTLRDSVAGFGTLRLPTANGAAAFSALMLRSVMQETDSLYLGSQPAPALLLRTLGMQQGQRYATCRTVFYRENSAQPALQFYYTDATFQTLRMWFGIWFSGEADLGTVTSVRAGLLPAGALQAYPNPVAEGRFTPELGGSRQPVQLLVRDLLGRQVAAGAATTGEPTTVLRGLRPGLYLVEAATRDGQRGTVRVQVQ